MVHTAVLMYEYCCCGLHLDRIVYPGTCAGVQERGTPWYMHAYTSEVHRVLMYCYVVQIDA